MSEEVTDNDNDDNIPEWHLPIIKQRLEDALHNPEKKLTWEEFNALLNNDPE